MQAPSWLLSGASGLNQTALLEVVLPQTQGSLVDLTKQVLIMVLRRQGSGVRA